MLTFQAKVLVCGRQPRRSGRKRVQIMSIATVRTAGPARAERWRDELGSAFNRLAPEGLGGHLPDGRMAGTGLGQLATFEVAGTPQVVRRTTGAVRQAPTDRLKICLQVRGRATVHQDGAEAVVEPGQMVLYDTSRPYDLRLEGAWVCAVLAFPEVAVGLPRGAVRDALMRTVSLVSGPGAVLAGFVSSAVAQRESIAGGAAERLGEAGLHLVAGALVAGAPSEGRPTVANADALRLRVLAHVRGHLGDPELGHASVAAAHHISPRTLTRLFEDQPYTVTDYIRARRLQAVKADLANPMLARVSIAAIAARWGFGDQAHFTRAFRAEFGTTPSAARPGLAG
jgi:AraC-like DNA-binding protein